MAGPSNGPIRAFSDCPMQRGNRLRVIGDLLWSATLHGLLIGALCISGISALGNLESGSPAMPDYPVGLVGAFIVSAAVAGPVVLLAIALFGTPAAVMVDRYRLGRWQSLAIILAFAALPILLLFWSANGLDGFKWSGLATWLFICGSFALPSAISLWRGLMRKRHEDASSPNIN